MLLLVACGLPQIAFLASPEIENVTSLPPQIVFSNTTDNDVDSFLGYELFYRFYDPATTAGGGVDDQFAADTAAIDAAAAGAVQSTILQRGYRRVQGVESDALSAGDSPNESPPLLQIPASESAREFSITVTFPGSTTSTEQATALWNVEGPREVILLRDQAALGNPVEPVGFNPADIDPAASPPQNDLPTGLDPAADSLRMGLVVVAYGVDYLTGTFGSIYSDADVASQLLVVSYQ